MQIAPVQPQPVAPTHANLHGAGGHAQGHILRPRITEDVSTEDSESLWMASAWRGNSGGNPNDQPAAASGTETSATQTPAAESTTPAAPPTGSRISYWA